MIAIRKHAEEARQRAEEAEMILKAYPDAVSGMEEGVWVSRQIQQLDYNHVLVVTSLIDEIHLVPARRFGETSFVVKQRFPHHGESVTDLLETMKRENPPLYQDVLTFVTEQHALPFNKRSRF